MCNWLRLKYTLRGLIGGYYIFTVSQIWHFAPFDIFIYDNSWVTYQFDVRNYHTHDSLV